MQITIVVDDKLVLIDRKPLELPELDWSVFDMDPNDPNDDVSAVQFDTAAGQGHVEFKTRLTKQATRPNVRPPDWRITSAEFEKHFAFVIPAYEAKARTLKAEQAAQDAERAARANDPEPAPAPVVDAVSREEAAAMATAAAEAAVTAFAERLAKGAGG